MAMTTENVHSVMDSPEFLAKSSESFFDQDGNLLTRPLFETRIKLKKGTRMTFIGELKTRAEAIKPSFLEFYLPGGYLTQAEIRGYEIPVDYPSTYDPLNLLVTLSTEQEAILFPYLNNRGDIFGY